MAAPVASHGLTLPVVGLARCAPSRPARPAVISSLPHWKSSHQEKKLRPSHLTYVALGANDLVDGRSPDLFASQLDEILAGLRIRTRAQIFVGDIPELANAPAFKEDPDPDVTTRRIAAFNERIRALVLARGCVLVPLSTLPTDPSMFSIDGFHPSTLGHRRIADLFWEEIRTRI